MNLEQLIATCLMVPREDPRDPTCIRGLPLNIIGLSGCGKSQRVIHACRLVGLSPFTVFPASKQPEDFGGAPFATADGIVVECILPQVNKLINLGEGVLFIDELSTARPSVQAAALGVVNDRRVGDHILPPKVRVVTAMNPAEYAASGFDLEAPLANRMMHVKYDPPSATEWVAWLTGSSSPKIPTIAQAEQAVLSGWSNHWPQVMGLLAGFMQAKPENLHKQPKPDDSDAGGAWPSHRMWNWAGRGIATSRCLNMPSDLEPKFVEGCVGQGVMQEWVEWVAKADLPSPHDVLTRGWRPDKHRLDITLAVLTGTTSWVCEYPDPPARIEYATRLWSLLGAVINAGMADMVVDPTSLMIRHELGHKHAHVPLAEAATSVLVVLGRNNFTTVHSALNANGRASASP